MGSNSKSSPLLGMGRGTIREEQYQGSNRSGLPSLIIEEGQDLALLICED